MLYIYFLFMRVKLVGGAFVMGKVFPVAVRLILFTKVTLSISISSFAPQQCHAPN